MNFQLIAELFCLVFAIIYFVFSLVKKEKDDQRHYTILTELWVVGLVICICITEVPKKNCKASQVKADTTHVKVDTVKPVKTVSSVYDKQIR